MPLPVATLAAQPLAFIDLAAQSRSAASTPMRLCNTPSCQHLARDEQAGAILPARSLFSMLKLTASRQPPAARR